MKTLTSASSIALVLALSACGDDPITLAEIIAGAQGSDTPGSVDPEPVSIDPPTAEVLPTPVSDVPGFPDPEPANEGDVDLEDRVIGILTEHCADCHSAPDDTPPTPITDIELLIARDYIIEGSRFDSRIYARMFDGSMPPVSTSVRVPPEDIETVGAFIDLL